MSERIRELAEQATQKFSRFGERDSWEKLFAELIVQECVAQCWTVSELLHKGEVISECSKRMRKHFGVE